MTYLRHDMASLWQTRRTSGFPWPMFGRGQIGGGWQMALTGYPSYSPVSLWRQVLRIPLRPIRYLRMVRAIARTRGMAYNVSDYDSVP
jgi:hypothetical protein